MPFNAEELSTIMDGLYALAEHGTDEDRTKANALVPKVDRALTRERGRELVNGRGKE